MLIKLKKNVTSYAKYMYLQYMHDKCTALFT